MIRTHQLLSLIASIPPPYPVVLLAAYLGFLKKPSLREPVFKYALIAVCAFAIPDLTDCFSINYSGTPYQDRQFFLILIERVSLSGLYFFVTVSLLVFMACFLPGKKGPPFPRTFLPFMIVLCVNIIFLYVGVYAMLIVETLYAP